ncbi:MAG: ABC transporter permease [Anaerolineae bacterium]|jgi:ABC-2 type transport system permease protein|nr:ABC transporter permease [Anaerolineae bacterium]
MKIWHIALNDLLVTRSSPSTWLFLFAVPAILVVVLALPNGGFQDPNAPVYQRLDVIDSDQSPASSDLLMHMRRANATLLLCPIDNDETDRCGLGDAAFTLELATERLRQGRTEGYLTIPAGFGEAVIGQTPFKLGFYSLPTTELNPQEPLLQTVNAALTRVNALATAQRFADVLYADLGGNPEFSQQVYQRAQSYWATEPITIRFEQTPAATINSDQPVGFQQSVPGTGSMYVMNVVLAGSVVLLLERKQGTMQRILTMPVSQGAFIAGKMLSRVILGMIQFMVAFAVGLLFGTRYGSDPIALILLMFAFVLCISGLALLLATVIKSEEQGSGLALFLMLTLAPLGGAWWSLELEFIPEFMRVIGNLTPVGWVMNGFNKLIVQDGGLIAVLPNIGILVAVAGVLFAIASYRLRYEQ